jgi:hypothetical protein
MLKGKLAFPRATLNEPIWMESTLKASMVARDGLFVLDETRGQPETLKMSTTGQGSLERSTGVADV